jgi:biopolymer transport protein ExbD
MTLPSSQKPPPVDPNKPKPKINRIVVDDKGEVFLNNEYVPDASLMTKFKSLLADDPDPKVVVKGSDEVEYQGMIKVLDALQQLNITKVGLATQ